MTQSAPICRNCAHGPNRGQSDTCHRWPDRSSIVHGSVIGRFELCNDERKRTQLHRESGPHKGNNMTDEQIKQITERFLAWRLPDSFNPDAGISFKPSYDDEPMRSRHWPVGTNLFSYKQAEAMVRHMLQGLPEDDDTRPLTEMEKAKIDEAWEIHKLDRSQLMNKDASRSGGQPVIMTNDAQSDALGLLRKIRDCRLPAQKDVQTIHGAVDIGEAWAVSSLTKLLPEIDAALEQSNCQPTQSRLFNLGDMVEKKKGSRWTGRVVGFYSTELTPVGYAVESKTEKGSVQIYPEAALAATAVIFTEQHARKRGQLTNTDFCNRATHC